MSADIHGLSGAYAVDAVDDDERAAFEAHLAECAECQAEVASLREAAAGLAPLADTAPPARLRDAVLAGISTVRPLPPASDGSADDSPAAVLTDSEAPPAQASRELAGVEGADHTVVPLGPRRRRRLAWLAAAAAAAVLVLGGVIWGTTRSEPQQISATEQVLHASDAQRFEKTIDGARATVVRSPSLHRAVIVADNMPPVPAGKDYQLWFAIPGKGMVSAGLMPHQASSTVTVPLAGDASQATGVGITVEPAGGSPAPTTAPVALIALS